MDDEASAHARGWRRLPRPLVREGYDRHRWAGPLAATGLAAGALLALLGLPPVDLHGPQHYVGIMTPFCGGTRGVHAAMLGRFGEAWHYNPLSAVLVVGAAAVLLREAVGRWRGRWLNLVLTRRRTAVAAGVAALVALEVNQQAHADLLRTGQAAGPSDGLLLTVTLALAAVVVLLTLLLVRRAGRG